MEAQSSQDDELAVGIAEDVGIPNLAAVELPLAVKPNESGIQSALSFIGGIEELSKVTADEERALKLHMRPQDPLCRPLVAQRNASDSSAFIFKVKRRRLRPKVELNGGVFGESEDTPWSIASVEAVGSVHTSFTFHSLADAQFLSCRPREVDAEEAIDKHIEAATTRQEPMELVPAAFLPDFPRVSQQSRQEKMLRREKKETATIKLERGELLVYHRFGEGVKHRTKSGSLLIKDAKAAEPLFDQMNKRWGVGRRPGRENRPSRLRKGVSGHNEVREQHLLLVQKIGALFEKRPMYSMLEIEDNLQDQPFQRYSIRDLVPAVAYYYCNGPWRSRWVRFGYNPEDHPTARFDQLLEFRIAPGQLRVWSSALGHTGDKKPGSATKTSSTQAVSSSTPTTPMTATATAKGSRTADPSAAAAAAAPTTAAVATTAGKLSAAISGKSPASNSRTATNNNNKNSSKSSSNSTTAAAPVGRSSNSSGTATSTKNATAAAAAAALPSGQHAPSATGKTGGGATGDDNTEEPVEEGIQVAEAEREEDDGLSSNGGPANRDSQEQGDREDSPQGFTSGGVVPEVGLTSKTKGRFASQLVINGRRVSVRNRVLIRESPFREVQELALKAPRLDRPGIVTGWWQQSTIEKMRTLTIEGTCTLVNFKKQEIAAAAAAAAATGAGAGAGAGASTVAGAPAASATSKGPAAVAGAATGAGKPSTGAAADQMGASGSSKNNDIDSTDSSTAGAATTTTNNNKGNDSNNTSGTNTGNRSGGASSLRHPARRNMTTEEFARMMDASEKDVQVVKVLASASSAAAMTAAGDAQTGTARQMMMARVAKKKSFSGTGIRSGSGRTSGGGGGGAKKMAGSKRSAAESGGGGGGGGGIVVPNISRDADRAVLRSDGDSEDSESDSVNSSDLVDDTEDSWDSDKTETSDDDEAEDEDEDEDDAEEGEKGTRDNHPRIPPPSGSGGGTAAGRGRGRRGAATTRSGDARSRRA